MWTPRSGKPSKPRDGRSPTRRPGPRRRPEPWKRRRPGSSRSVRGRLPAPTRKPRGVSKATAAAMEEAERKINRKTPPGGSCVDTLRSLFEGDPVSRIMIDRDAEDARSSKGSGRPTVTTAGARGIPPKRHRGPPRSTPTTLTPSSLTAMSMDETGSITESPQAARREWPELAAEEAMAPLQAQMERAHHLPIAAGRVIHAAPRRDLDSIGEARTLTTTWESAQVSAHAASGMHPWEEDPQVADRPQDP